MILNKRGSLDEALSVLQEGERIGRRLGDKLLVLDVLGHQGHLMKRRQEHQRALALFKAQEAICRELGVQQSLGFRCVSAMMSFGGCLKLGGMKLGTMGAKD